MSITKQRKSLDDINPATPQEAEGATVAEEAKPVDTSLPQVALGIFVRKEGPGTKHVLVEIAYNPATGTVGYIKEVYSDTREDTVNKFKVAVDQHGLFN